MIPNRVALCGKMQSSEPVFVNGRKMDLNSLAVVPPIVEYCGTSSAPNQWFILTFSVYALARECGRRGLSDLEASTPSAIQHIVPGIVPACCDLVRKLTHAKATHEAPLFREGSERSAEQELWNIIIEALSAYPGQKKHPGRPMTSQNRIIRQSLDVLKCAPDQPFYVADFCQAAHVSERTLRNAFHSFFGIGPISYLRLRRLHQIRSRLMQSDPREVTVTDTAFDLGVWDLGRFAAEYKALFGETPAQTLGVRRFVGSCRGQRSLAPNTQEKVWQSRPGESAPQVRDLITNRYLGECPSSNCLRK